MFFFFLWIKKPVFFFLIIFFVFGRNSYTMIFFIHTKGLKLVKSFFNAWLIYTFKKEIVHHVFLSQYRKLLHSRPSRFVKINDLDIFIFRLKTLWFFISWKFWISVRVTVVWIVSRIILSAFKFLMKLWAVRIFVKHFGSFVRCFASKSWNQAAAYVERYAPFTLSIGSFESAKRWIEFSTPKSDRRF